MNGHQIEELYHAGRIDAFVPSKTCCQRMLRVTQIDQGYGKLTFSQSLLGEFRQRTVRGFVDESLQPGWFENTGWLRRGRLHSLLGRRRSRKKKQRYQEQSDFESIH